MIKVDDKSDWYCAEDRAAIESETEYKKPMGMLVFALPARYWHDAKDESQQLGTAFRAVCTDPDILQDNMDLSRAMKKSHRTLFQDGVRVIDKQLDASDECLKNDHDTCYYRAPLAKCLVVSDSNFKQVLKGMPNVCFVDTGIEARSVTSTTFLKTLQKKYEEAKPSFVLSYLGECELNFDETAEYFFMLEMFAKAGVGVLHVDSTCNGRWSPLSVSYTHLTLPTNREV